MIQIQRVTISTKGSTLRISVFTAAVHFWSIANPVGDAERSVSGCRFPGGLYLRYRAFFCWLQQKRQFPWWWNVVTASGHVNRWRLDALDNGRASKATDWWGPMLASLRCSCSDLHWSMNMRDDHIISTVIPFFIERGTVLTIFVFHNSSTFEYSIKIQFFITFLRIIIRVLFEEITGCCSIKKDSI